MVEKTTAVRKLATRFRVGEVMYLHGCDTGSLYGMLRGPFLIDQIKNQSDTGVSFFLSPYRVGLTTAIIDSGMYLVEFARTDKLTRIRGPVITTTIEELP